MAFGDQISPDPGAVPGEIDLGRGLRDLCVQGLGALGRLAQVVGPRHVLVGAPRVGHSARDSDDDDQPRLTSEIKFCRKQYSADLVLLVEAEREFSSCRSEMLQMVDNYAILSLDIAWCYLSVHAVSELPDAEQKLARCEEKFKSSYGRNMERVAALKGSQSNELALMARLHLLQGVVAFHLGRDREARLQLEKVSTEMQLLSVDEMKLMEIVSMGYTVAEAGLGLRASLGDRKLAVDHIIRRREEKAEILKKEKEERERGRLREKLGRCGNGDWVNVGYYKTLLSMGYTSKVAAAALRQSNNSLNTAVQMLQEEPDLIALAAEERNETSSLEEPSDEMVASVVALGFTADMARTALQNEGSVEGAVDQLMAGGGVVAPSQSRGKRRRRDEEDEEAPTRETDSSSRSDRESLNTSSPR